MLEKQKSRELRALPRDTRLLSGGGTEMKGAITQFIIQKEYFQKWRKDMVSNYARTTSGN
jgi:hypothetical protein